MQAHTTLIIVSLTFSLCLLSCSTTKSVESRKEMNCLSSNDFFKDMNGSFVFTTYEPKLAQTPGVLSPMDDDTVKPGMEFGWYPIKKQVLDFQAQENSKILSNLNINAAEDIKEERDSSPGASVTFSLVPLLCACTFLALAALILYLAGFIKR